MNAKEAIDILSDCRDSEIGGYCGRSQEVAKFIETLQAENDRLRTENNITKEMNERLKIDWTKMQKQYQLSVLECCTMELEEKRLRTIEEKARAVVKVLNSQKCLHRPVFECDTDDTISDLEDALIVKEQD